MPTQHEYPEEFFEISEEQDKWSTLIADWQNKTIDVGAAPQSENTPSTTLRKRYTEFRRERKRVIAQELALWLQAIAKEHYIHDKDHEHWPTFEETLANNGDDCDGLELLAYYWLLDLGFSKGTVFRAVAFNEELYLFHMVTLWFEFSEDPWVIDPTGAMTKDVSLLSDNPEWRILRSFNETGEFVPRTR